MKKRNKAFSIIAIGITLFIIAMIILVTYVRQDIKRQSKNNYEALLEQLETISRDFDKVYTYDNVIIEPQENGIKLILTAPDSTNVQNELTAYFSSDFTFINSTHQYPYIVTTIGYIQLLVIIVSYALL